MSERSFSEMLPQTCISNGPGMYSKQDIKQQQKTWNLTKNNPTWLIGLVFLNRMDQPGHGFSMTGDWMGGAALDEITQKGKLFERGSKLLYFNQRFWRKTFFLFGMTCTIRWGMCINKEKQGKFSLKISSENAWQWTNNHIMTTATPPFPGYQHIKPLSASRTLLPDLPLTSGNTLRLHICLGSVTCCQYLV